MWGELVQARKEGDEGREWNRHGRKVETRLKSECDEREVAEERKKKEEVGNRRNGAKVSVEGEHWQEDSRRRTLCFAYRPIKSKAVT
jgi:hypothetical protein